MEHGAKVRAQYFAVLHPSVCMAYFVAAIGLTLACSHPAAAALSLAGGTAFSKAMIEMQVAVETNGKSLKDFARVAGLTTEEFKAL